MSKRSLIDSAIIKFDRQLRKLTSQPSATGTGRLSPAANAEDASQDQSSKQHAAGLMRINHTGEVCAQALYQGQALTAKLPDVRESMERAALEEVDHLLWCEQRLEELESQPSKLNPIFYGMSFLIGATAGLAGDKWSLGFVAATEDQVCQHLREHLEKLPESDHKSRAILTQMLSDEGEHAVNAIAAGGVEFPVPVKQAMTMASKLMTTSTYYL